jgi:hypothetical protein
MVPPETPGTMSAAPIAMPFKKTKNAFMNFMRCALNLSSAKLRRNIYEEKVRLLASR